MLEDGRLGKLLTSKAISAARAFIAFREDTGGSEREEGPAGGMTGRGVHVVDAMMYLAGQVDTVNAQSFRLALDYGIDDTTSMLFRFRSGATGYLGTVIATAETWRMQVFGSKGWVGVGDVEHLTTWQMRVCSSIRRSASPQASGGHVPGDSTERAELENFADAIERSTRWLCRRRRGTWRRGAGGDSEVRQERKSVRVAKGGKPGIEPPDVKAPM